MLAENIQSTASRPDTPLARQIADAIAEKGYVVNVNVGRSHFKVDVAVSRQESPDAYVLGILLDGESYRDTQTTRDREIVQPSVLEGLGWRVMRVWSVDWLNNPQRVIDRVMEQLETAPVKQETAAPVKFDISKEKVIEKPSFAREYQELKLSPEEAKAMTSRKLIQAIVHQEQPITLKTLCRRICTLRGDARVTSFVQDTTRDYVSQKFFLENDREGKVIWESEKDRDDYRWYRPAAGREISEVSMREIRNAVIEAVTEQFSISADALSLIVSKKLGFMRRGAKVDNAINEAFSQLVKEGVITDTDGSLSANLNP